VIASILTPFLAYFPPIMLGGSGVLATAITGFVISNRYGVRFTPEFRLVSRAIWPSISFAIQSILFLLIGLDMRLILDSISSISGKSLFIYSAAVILVIIIGRFIWVYPATYVPRWLFPSILKKDPYPPWQYPIVVSWAGMRGGVSLAAALAVPVLPATVEGANPRDLLIFLVFCAIAATFILQGLTLPWILKVTGVHEHGQRERYDEHLSQLTARKKMIQAALRWLSEYKENIKDNPKVLDQVKLYIQEYRMLKAQLKERIAAHDGITTLAHDEQAESREEACLLSQILEVEKEELLKLWRKEKINLTVRNNLLAQLDHRSQHISI
jgi:CPA1 family monovalent cation:H+ antiporter